MINNIRVAQPVQTGVQKADIIYETEVEGGITRLLAVFKNISAVGQIGTVRSARVPYIDLALGHDAIYVHCGIDPTYATPYVTQTGVNNFNINSNPWAAYGFREPNGLSSEHTMYTTSDKLKEGFAALKFRTTTDKNTPWCSFNKPDESTVPTGGLVEKLTVKFSNTATSVFTYNAETKLFTKNSANQKNADYKTGETYDIKNVFVLSTSITNYPDNKHRKVALNGGAGWYASEGGYTEIIWKKAGSKQPIQFFNTDGTPLKVNAGKSWVCIQNANFTPTFTAPVPPETSQSGSATTPVQ